MTKIGQTLRRHSARLARLISLSDAYFCALFYFCRYPFGAYQLTCCIYGHSARVAGDRAAETGVG